MDATTGRQAISEELTSSLSSEIYVDPLDKLKHPLGWKIILLRRKSQTLFLAWIIIFNIIISLKDFVGCKYFLQSHHRAILKQFKTNKGLKLCKLR